MDVHQPATLAGRRVLLVHQDAFQASYLADVIADRGAMIVVVGTSDAALSLLDADPPPCALVLSGALPGEAVVRRAANKRHVATLLLRMARIEPPLLDGHPLALTAPFAAFQVADALIPLLADRQENADRLDGPRLRGH